MENNHFSTLRKAILRIIGCAFLLSALMLLMACGGSKTISDTEDFKQLKELINSREFEIEHDRARPSRGGNIYLTGAANFIRFKEDSITVSLPFYGERYSGGYGSEAGIKYEGPVKNLKVITNKEEQEIILKFEGQQGMENFQFYITLFPNGNASTSVNSSQRSPISYRGNIKPLAEEWQ